MALGVGVCYTCLILRLSHHSSIVFHLIFQEECYGTIIIEKKIGLFFNAYKAPSVVL